VSVLWISRFRLRITRSVFVIFLFLRQMVVVVQNTYQSTLGGCKVCEFESTRFGPESVGR